MEAAQGNPAEAAEYRLWRRREDGASDATNGVTISAASSLAGIFDDWKGDSERWLFIVPHDDDACIGAGLLLQLAVQAGVSVSVVITTDGSMGYCSIEQRDSIVAIRQKETLAGLRLLGVDAVEWLGFPDCDLARFQGRRAAAPGTAAQIAGYSGLENSYTCALRRIRPGRLFLPTANDLHPDHKIVYQEALISVFHAGGSIWPELGAPISSPPRVYEMAIYCAFPGPPHIKIEGSRQSFRRKLDSIAAFRSQGQIGQIVEGIRAAGPFEFFREADLKFYSPKIYTPLFESPPSRDHGDR